MDKKITIQTIKEMKATEEKITMLTAYDYSMAKLVDESGVDVILVGDSLGMVMLGYEDTLSVTMEDMIRHSAAVSRGTKKALIVADMPFMSYQTDTPTAIKNAGELIVRGGAEAVKLEGGIDFVNEIKGIVRAGIPVMGHLGLTPQSVHKFGGYKVQGKTEEAAETLVNDALALEDAGVFSIVIECVPEDLGKMISDKVTVPTIGIGAGRHVDGQVLVIHDMLGLFEKISPKFAKGYLNMGELIKSACSEYIDDTKSGKFPGPEHIFEVDGK